MGMIELRNDNCFLFKDFKKLCKKATAVVKGLFRKPFWSILFFQDIGYA